jgi:hypothetical protein
MFRFTTTERNHPVLNYANFQYTIKRTNKTSTEWRCRNRNCSTTLLLSLDNTCIRREPGDHNELCKESQPSKALIEETLEIMKRRAREETTTISKIYSEEIVALRIRYPGIPTGFYFPPLNSIDSALYYHRSQNYPALPKHLDDLALSGEWILTSHGERFLLIDEVCKFFYCF